MVGLVLFLLGLASFVLAHKFGKPYFVYGKMMTQGNMSQLAHYVDMRVKGIEEEYGRPVENPIAQFPSAAGEYDAASLLSKQSKV